jgi:hypothetical protein
MEIIKKIRRFFFGETYQEVLDRKYGGSIPSNVLVNDRELNKGKKKKFKVDTCNEAGVRCNKLFYPHHLNKHHFRKKKITKIFLL